MLYNTFFLKCALMQYRGGTGIKERINICEQKRHSVPTRMVYLGYDLISWAVRSHYQIYELSLSKPLEGCLAYIKVNNLISSSLSVSVFHT